MQDQFHHMRNLKSRFKTIIKWEENPKDWKTLVVSMSKLWGMDKLKEVLLKQRCNKNRSVIAITATQAQSSVFKKSKKRNDRFQISLLGSNCPKKYIKGSHRLIWTRSGTWAFQEVSSLQTLILEGARWAGEILIYAKKIVWSSNNFHSLITNQKRNQFRVE